MTRAQSTTPQECSSLARCVLGAEDTSGASAFSHEVEGCNLEWITAEVTNKSRGDEHLCLLLIDRYYFRVGKIGVEGASSPVIG